MKPPTKMARPVQVNRPEKARFPTGPEDAPLRHKYASRVRLPRNTYIALPNEDEGVYLEEPNPLILDTGNVRTKLVAESYIRERGGTRIFTIISPLVLESIKEDKPNGETILERFHPDT